MIITKDEKTGRYLLPEFTFHGMTYFLISMVPATSPDGYIAHYKFHYVYQKSKFDMASSMGRHYYTKFTCRYKYVKGKWICDFTPWNFVSYEDHVIIPAPAVLNQWDIPIPTDTAFETVVNKSIEIMKQWFQGRIIKLDIDGQS